MLHFCGDWREDKIMTAPLRNYEHLDFLIKWLCTAGKIVSE
jgi:hypothetical protein